MKRIMHLAEVVLWASVLCAFLVRPVYAYLDPGSGSFLLQALIASLVGAMFLIKQFWSRIWASLRKFGSRTFRSGMGHDERQDEA
jgi:hypothetical protein